MGGEKLVMFEVTNAFFSESTEALEDLTAPNLERLDLIKSRYLYHRQHGHLLEHRYRRPETRFLLWERSTLVGYPMKKPGF
jgi:hypothetical protein